MTIEEARVLVLDIYPGAFCFIDPINGKQTIMTELGTILALHKANEDEAWFSAVSYIESLTQKDAPNP